MTGAFDASALLRDAMQVDGLEEFGHDDFREPLRVLATALGEAPLNDLGTTILRSQLVRSLANRLRTHYWFSRHPEIADERIARPLIVVGMMRSGTTLIQRLLAQDPDTAFILGWEAMEPAPRLGVAPGTPDPRIASAEKREEQSRTFVPQLFAIHPSYAHEAEEEIMILTDAFLSHVPESYCHVPVYRSWLDEQEFAPAYRHLHRTLQLLQWCKKERGESCRRWVLKTPAHLGYLDQVLHTFPDAHIVHMHRDPLATIPSGASLNATLWRLHQDAVDAAEVGRQWLQRMAWTNGRAMAFREGYAAEQHAFTDVRFSAAVADPMAQVRYIYARAGIELTSRAEGAMRAWLARDQHATLAPHRYTALDFGLHPQQITEAFADYSRRYLDGGA